MGTFWALLVLLIVFVLLGYFFKKIFVGLLIMLFAELAIVIIWPQTLVLLADLAVKVRQLIGG